ncbi:hypothetical protein PRIPAC_97511 [Pristionchus pacificus]|uniref:Uncharacterized protein n=1 Tax=Pristionchus pacificus TaxID=54126 RepID=A0A2A6CUT7_PRIPA|nr:hypothetical protein PRIPAC_97511 [Pristionchus pacificus]|eukprot:PDM81860.1 hypothetical protein PRIPAC_34014 [Pristionchus pacificus]
MEAGFHVDFNSDKSIDYDTNSKIIGEGRYEKEASVSSLQMDIVFFVSQIHIVLGVFSLIPVGFLLRTSRNNLEISRERPFLALILFTLFCSMIRTGQHIFYLLSTGETISTKKCTIMAHTYYVAEVLPQQMALIILVYALLENHRNISFDFRNQFKCAGIVIVIAIALNTIQYFIGTPSPNFPLCLPYNINFELNDVYHHIGFCVLFTNIGISAYLHIGSPGNPAGSTPREVQNSIFFTLLSYSSSCLMVILPLSIYTHVHEFPVWMLAVSVNAFEYFHSFSAGFISTVFICRLPYLRTLIIDSIGLRNRFLMQLLE